MNTALFVITTLKRTGPVNILYDLIKFLDRSIYRAHVLTLCPEDGESRWIEFEALGASVESLNLSRGFSFPIAASRLKGVADRVKPDVVHSIGFRADVLGAVFLRKYAKLSSQLNYPFDDYVMTYGPRVGGIMAWLTVWALKRYDFSVACATDVAHKMAKKGVPCEVVYNSIDDTRFVPVSIEQRQARRLELGIPINSGLVFIFVGVLSDRKQPLVALSAFLRFRKDHPTSFLVVLGDGPLSAECKQLAGGNGVIFAGNVRDTRPYLTASDVYVATSKAEGMPVSVLEALALRLPVILSDIEPHREILSIDHNAGILVRTGSTDDTERGMYDLAQRDLSILGQHARQIIDRELSARVMARRFQDLYARMIP